MQKTQSAGGVVLNSKGEVLIVNQRGVSWSLPKGHVDKGEDILKTAHREIYEESGISDLTLIKKLGTITRQSTSSDGNKKEQKTIHIFLFTTKEMNLCPQDPHNPEARWVTKKKASSMLTNEKDRDFFVSKINEF